MAQDISIDLNVPIVDPKTGLATTAFEDILSTISTVGTVSTGDNEALDRQVNFPRETQVGTLKQQIKDIEAQIRRPVAANSVNASQVEEIIMRQTTIQVRALLGPIKQRLALRPDLLGKGFAANNDHIALFLHGSRIAIRNAELGCTRCYGCDKIPPCLGGVVLQGGAIDGHWFPLRLSGFPHARCY